MQTFGLQLQKLLTKREVADRLGISTRTIDRMIERDEFPRGRKVARLVRWAPEVIDKWIRNE